jgi:hypothetical protein
MSPSFPSFQISFVIGLLANAVLCGAWWYAALQKRKVAIFYWLAAAHTLSFAMHALTVVSILTRSNAARLASIGPAQTLTAVALSGLYVALVRWLVNQPDTTT